MADRLRRASRNGPLSGCQAVCVTAAIALCTILAIFAPLLAGLAENISTGDSAALATLTEAYRPAHQLFRFALTVLLLALLHGLLQVRRSVGLDGGGAASVQMGALLALLGAILLMLAVPWRVVREPEFREATWNGALCFVVGAHDTDVLVHCPALPVPRNRVVSTRDPRLVLHDRKSDLFAAYAAREAPASTSTE